MNESNHPVFVKRTVTHHLIVIKKQCVSNVYDSMIPDSTAKPQKLSQNAPIVKAFTQLTIPNVLAKKTANKERTQQQFFPNTRLPAQSFPHLIPNKILITFPLTQTNQRIKQEI